jgi:hypothetical protein
MATSTLGSGIASREIHLSYQRALKRHAVFVFEGIAIVLITGERICI